MPQKIAQKIVAEIVPKIVPKIFYCTYLLNHSVTNLKKIVSNLTIKSDYQNPDFFEVLARHELLREADGYDEHRRKLNEFLSNLIQEKLWKNQNPRQCSKAKVMVRKNIFQNYQFLKWRSYSLYICLQELRIISFSVVNMTEKSRCCQLDLGHFFCMIGKIYSKEIIFIKINCWKSYYRNLRTDI